MKIGQIYNLKAFKAFLDSAKKPGFKDSYAGTVLARNLTYVDPKLFEKKYPELSFVNSGIQADNSGGVARRIQSLRILEQGDFATAGDISGNKGKISIHAEDSFLPVVVRNAHSEWSDDEIKENDLQGINLVSKFISSHNKIYMRNIDQIGFLGLGTQEGLLNYSGFASAGSANTFPNLTAQQMYDEVAEAIQAQWNGVNNTPEYKADRVVMPVATMNLLTATILDTASSTKSVLKSLQDNYLEIQFMSTFRATTDLVVYSTNRESMVMRVPVPLTVGEIIKVSSFDFRVDSKYRIGGLDVLEDTSGYVLTDVAA